jgi:hypothetical protein
MAMQNKILKILAGKNKMLDIFFGMHFFSSLFLTGSLYLMDSFSNDTRKWTRYLLLFLLLYVTQIPGKLRAENEILDQIKPNNVLVEFEIYQQQKIAKIFDKKFPCEEFNQNFYTIEQFEEFLQATDKGIPSRDELIAKMQTHNIGYTKAIKMAEKTLQDAGIWNWYLEELFESAKNGIYVVVGGSKSLRAFVVSIIDYSFKLITQGCSIYKTYYHYIYEADYHAEMFDFYYGMLIYYYGK